MNLVKTGTNGGADMIDKFIVIKFYWYRDVTHLFRDTRGTDEGYVSLSSMSLEEFRRTNYVIDLYRALRLEH